MARRVPWRRNCPDVVSYRIEQANQARIYLLRETGPTGFLLKQDGIDKKFKVFLGDLHSCTCSTFMKEKELCIHILWVLLKKFRVPKENEVVFQLSLVEREINEVMRGAYVPAQRAAEPKSENTHTDNRDKMKQKEISEEDVCPICQDELLDKCEPLTYCKYGCGNSVHIKCMKVWAEHQRSTGEKITKCPLCRVDFGTFQELMDEFNKSSRKNTRSERHDVHLGASCNKCRVCPITGKCYRCVICSDYHLCHPCFLTDHHMQHSFQFRQNASQRWRPASRITPLPSAVIESLQTREITDNDYDLLLQLDRPLAEQEGVSGHMISRLPVDVLREGHPLLARGSTCGVCLSAYHPLQYVRKLQCRHVFHRDCIDSWLATQSICPVDGQTVGVSYMGVAHTEVAPPVINSAVQGAARGRLLNRRRETRKQLDPGNTPVTLPSSFELSGSGILARDRSRDSSPSESGRGRALLVDCSPSNLIEANRLRNHEPAMRNPLQINGKPPWAPNTTNTRGSQSSDSRKRTPARGGAQQKRKTLSRDHRNNSVDDIFLSATGRAVSIENLSRDTLASSSTVKPKGHLIKGKLACKVSDYSHSDSELSTGSGLVALAIQMPAVDR